MHGMALHLCTACQALVKARPQGLPDTRLGLQPRYYTWPIPNVICLAQNIACTRARACLPRSTTQPSLHKHYLAFLRTYLNFTVLFHGLLCKVVMQDFRIHGQHLLVLDHITIRQPPTRCRTPLLLRFLLRSACHWRSLLQLVAQVVCLGLVHLL